MRISLKGYVYLGTIIAHISLKVNTIGQSVIILNMQIYGADEVGRGCLAGPMLACAIPFDALSSLPESILATIKDSKKLTSSVRASITQDYLSRSLPYHLSCITASEIDTYSMAWAAKEIFERLIERNSGIYLIDGNLKLNHPYKSKSISLIKADTFAPAVSLASIIAKHFRDQYMEKIDSKYPGYGFKSHVGYATKIHRQAIKEHGLCPEHRQSFIHFV